MDWRLYTRIVGEMAEAGVEEIGVFYLGESLMAPGLTAKAIKYAKGIGIPYVFLTTNASLLTPKVAVDLFEAELDSLKFSVNAADARQFAEIMGVKPALFREALENIKVARAIRDRGKYDTKLYASSIRFDGDQQARMADLIENEVRPFVDEWYELPLYSMGSVATQREEELGYRPTAGNQGRIGALRDPLPCWSAFSEGHVRADGGLSACCFDADARWVMGDLTKQSFMEAWNSQVFQDLRAAHLRKDVTGTPCEECVAYQG